MRRLLMFSVAMLLLVSFTTQAVFAQNPHFVGTPSITDQGTTLRARGSIAGLGNGDVTVTLTATATVIVDCRNPGGNIAPGQRTTATASGSQTIEDPKNGRVNFNVTATVSTPSAADVCPNRKWTVIVQDVQFTNVQIIVEQGGQVVLTFP